MTIGNLKFMSLISHRHKFIFIHIYKTAGTSVTASLLRHSSFKDRLAYDYLITKKLSNTIDRIFNSWDDGKKWLTGYHKHSQAIEIREHLGSSCFDEYYKFSFVRNSWDWLVSLYFYIRRENTHINHHLANQLNFKEFLQNYLETNPPLQLDFISDSQGKIIVDKIGCFEQLQQDFAEILDRIQIEDRQYNSPNLKVINMSSNRSRNYQQYYDGESSNWVEEYFQPDIAYFKFQFESSQK